MKRVTVTERHTYEVDVDELLIRLANFIRGDVHVQDFGRCVESEVVLVEIEDAGESGTEPRGKAASVERTADDKPEQLDKHSAYGDSAGSHTHPEVEE